MADTIESFVRAGSFRESWRDRFQNKWPAMTMMMMKTETEIDYPDITPCPNFGVKNPSIRSWSSSNQDTWAESRGIDQDLTDEESSSRATKKGTRCGRICNGILCVFLVLSVLIAAFAGIGLAILLTQPQFGLSGKTHTHDDSHIDAGLDETEKRILTEKFCNLVKDILHDVNFPTDKGISNCEAVLQLMKGSEGLHIELHVIPTEGYTLKEKFIRALAELVSNRRETIDLGPNTKTNISEKSTTHHGSSDFIFPKTGGPFKFVPDMSTHLHDNVSETVSIVVPGDVSIVKTKLSELGRHGHESISGHINDTNSLQNREDVRGSIKNDQNATEDINRGSQHSNSSLTTELKADIDIGRETTKSNSTVVVKARYTTIVRTTKTDQKVQMNNTDLEESTSKLDNDFNTSFKAVKINNTISTYERKGTMPDENKQNATVGRVTDGKFMQTNAIIDITPDVTSASTTISELDKDIQTETASLATELGINMQQPFSMDTVTSVGNINSNIDISNKNAKSMMNNSQNGNTSQNTISQNKIQSVTSKLNVKVSEDDLSQQPIELPKLSGGNHTDIEYGSGSNITTKFPITSSVTGVMAPTPTKEYLKSFDNHSSTVSISQSAYSNASGDTTVSDIYGERQETTEPTQLKIEITLNDSSNANPTLTETVSTTQTQTWDEHVTESSITQETDATTETKRPTDVIAIKSIKLFDIDSVSNTSDSVPIYVNETGGEKGETDFVAESLMTGGVFKLPMRTTSNFKFLFSSGPRKNRQPRTRKDSTTSVVVVRNKHIEKGDKTTK